MVSNSSMHNVKCNEYFTYFSFFSNPQSFSGLSGFCVFIWTVVMVCYYGLVKWDHQNDYIWIIVGPMATVLIVRRRLFISLFEF